MYREVHMEEVKEVVLLWLAGTGKKRIGVQLGLDVKTVRRYVRAAYKVGLRVREHTAPLSEEVVGAILKEIRPAAARERGEAWGKRRLCRTSTSIRFMTFQCPALGRSGRGSGYGWGSG